MLHRRSDLGEMHIGEIGDAFGTSGQFRMGARKPLRNKAGERGGHFLPGMIAAQSFEPGQNIYLRRHVDDDVLALAPIGGYLQDRRTAQSPMREKQGLVE